MPRDGLGSNGTPNKPKKAPANSKNTEVRQEQQGQKRKQPHTNTTNANTNKNTNSNITAKKHGKEEQKAVLEYTPRIPAVYVIPQIQLFEEFKLPEPKEIKKATQQSKKAKRK